MEPPTDAAVTKCATIPCFNPPSWRIAYTNPLGTFPTVAAEVCGSCLTWYRTIPTVSIKRVDTYTPPTLTTV